VKICRLHELSDLEAVSLFLRGEIQPASISEGSDWVCRARQRPHFWGLEGVRSIAESDKGERTMCWVGFDEKEPVGLCLTGVDKEGVEILLYLVKTSVTKAEQFAIADEIALVALAAFPPTEMIGGFWPEHGWAADYARRCGFNSTKCGKDTGIIPEPNPILRWEIPLEDLKKNIEGFRGRD